VNGGSTILTQRIQERRRRSTRWLALLLALLFFGITLLSPWLLSGLIPQPPIVVDGNFADWGGVPVVPDSALDASANENINLVAFAATQSDREVYFYAQVQQGGAPFGSGTPGIAEVFRLFIDRDRSQASGFLVHGIGAEVLVELTGYDGALRASSLKVFPAFVGDRTDASLFESAGAVRAIARGNQMEGSVPLADLAASSGRAPPFLLFDTADSNGVRDLGDAVFSSRPGLLVVQQTPSNATVVPDDRDTLLLAATAQALHQNITLSALTIAVDGAGGGGVRISQATLGTRSFAVNRTAEAGGTVRVDFSGGLPVSFDPAGSPQAIQIFGRATGAPGAASVRVALNGSQFVVTGAPPPATSGHGSVFPPTAFERAYVAAAPDRIVIDGAFADWNPMRPASVDPDDDLRRGTPPVPANATPPPGPLDQNIDIREAIADVNTGPAEVSFYLSVDGSIFPGRLPPLPEVPGPSQPSPGGGGGGGGQPPNATGVDGDLATVYIDTDNDPLTGWLALPGLGIDAVVQVWGTGGGLGRAPRAAASAVAFFDNASLAFNRSGATASVGLSSSKMEAQVPSSALCTPACGRIRYAFAFQDRAGAFDVAGPFTSSLRGDGQALDFVESAPSSLTAFQGDLDAPVLVVSLASSPANTRLAQLNALLVVFAGLAPGDITSVSLYRDSSTVGVLEPSDIAAGAVAAATLEPGQYARLVPFAALILGPGERFDGIVAVDLSPTATAPAFLNASSARAFGARASGITDVRYAFPANSTPVHVQPAAGPGRGQNDIVVNEVNFVSGFIEFWDTTGAPTNLTSPSIMGFTVYRTNNNGNNVRTVAIRRLPGSTNSEGFTAFNYSVPLSTSTIKYYVGLWCNNCTAGRGPTGSNNATYVDYMQMPRFTLNGSWGRYPDGNVTPRNTTNDTRADNNSIPPNDNGTAPSGQNNLIINEANVAFGWVEVFATHGAKTSLSSPSVMGIEIYYTNNGGGNHNTVAIRVLSGNTTDAGFAAVNVTVPLSTANRRYHVGLWCSNCTAGQDFRGRNNRTYLDDVEMPRTTANGSWGRFPDANDEFVNTTNDTRAEPNEIPEFGDLLVPLGGVVAIMAVSRRRAARAEDPANPGPMTER
jgi:hypothetical protein